MRFGQLAVSEWYDAGRGISERGGGLAPWGGESPHTPWLEVEDGKGVRMRRRFRLMVSGACALVAALACGVYGQHVRDEAERVRTEALERYGGEVVSLLVAPDGLEAGEVVDRQNVVERDWLADLAPEGAVVGIDAVLVTPTCCDPFYRRAVRVSMGTVFQVPWTYLPEIWPQTLRALGFTTAAMALCDASLPIYAPQLKRADRLAVVLGTEGDGLAESTIAACDCTVRIPMTHGVDSLNVAAASAVAFYQLALLAGLSETED